jgi:hypothetical protein
MKNRRMGLTRLATGAAIASLLVLVAAQAAPPATMPSDAAPATAPSTLGHPTLDAYAAYSGLALEGNGQKMLDMYLLRTNEEGRAAVAVVKADLAAARLAAATFARFGRDGMVAEQRAFGDARPEWLSVKLDPNGQVAVLVDDHNNPVTTMQLHEGKWWFVVTPFIERLGGPDKLAAAAGQQERRANELRAQITAGRFKTPDELITAISTGK